MNEIDARAKLPLFAAENDNAERLRAELRHEMQDRVYKMKKRYGLSLIILFVWAASMMVGCCLTGWIVGNRTEKRVREEEAAYYEQKLADYHEQRQQEQAAQYFLTGEASREAAINQATDAVAGVIARLGTDQQKLTEAACILARVMNKSYPNSFEEVCAQPGQWMFYDGSDKTFSQHDRELADRIVRPYMESGIIPNGLTQDMVYGAWSTNDFVLRDSYENAANMHTWRAQ
jgi:hypothetical protein